jgi:hypothetical protein
MLARRRCSARTQAAKQDNSKVAVNHWLITTSISSTKQKKSSGGGIGTHRASPYVSNARAWFVLLGIYAAELWFLIERSLLKSPYHTTAVLLQPSAAFW